MITNCCDREVVKTIPERAYPIKCGGKECDHRMIYGLIDEDCRQVILIVPTSAKWGDAATTVTME